MAGCEHMENVIGAGIFVKREIKVVVASLWKLGSIRLWKF
jgi:hypothetical protein